ncbi:histidine kinase N-terminal 7TM domain-containing protein [Natrinema sp. 1APR25-10V2]|uniref:histidine kinase N-terminal 7TM domain-containing protein n=1 Tax=Natrinema sp. 1APR25-10V2 TaxID=2951081 RepID=UPI0028756F26|nr:histidine kinase N-terminal 7TM domain-containing protein [Natrinema sp. 1APR25-10V2]MDS0476395.1 ATP-binding protein [Natrinema sp. 1APR25-10V2]
MLASTILSGILLSAIAIGATAALLSWRERPEPGAVPLVVMLAGQCWWSALLIFDLEASTLGAKMFWANLRWIGVVSVPIGWMLFSLEYTGRDQYVRPRYVALLSVVPLLTVVFALTGNPLLYTDSELVRKGGLLLLRRTPGPWFWVITAYTYLLGLLGSVPLLELIRNDSLPFRGQSAALLVGILAPWVSNIFFLADAVPLPGLDPTPVAFSISGVAYLGALTRFQLFGTSPSPNPRARRLLFDRMPDGAIVTDGHNNVVEINETGAELLGTVRRRALGRPLRELVPDESLVPSGESGVEHGPFQSPGDERLYDVTATAVTDIHDRTIGHVITFHDISEHVRQQQRHEVLNRVFRHNIRTETNVISSYAELLSSADDRGESDEINSADEIIASAHRIEELANKARKIISIFERGRESTETVGLEPLLDDSIETVRDEYPDAHVECESADGIYVAGVLEPVFDNLIENGVEHNPDPAPTVRISVRTDDDWVRVRIADDGPGIDATERSTLERGTETPLDHGSGLGLWLAKWGAEIAGGSITFEANEPTGSVVTVEVPLLSPSDTDDAQPESSEITP